MHLSAIILLIAVAWILQFALTWFQIRHYRVKMKELFQQYKNSEGYYLFSGVSRKALGSGAIVLLVINYHGIIENAQVLAGMSVFAKFKVAPEYIGKQVDHVLRESKIKLEGKNKLSSKSQSVAKASQMATENALRSLSIKKTNIAQIMS